MYIHFSKNLKKVLDSTATRCYNTSINRNRPTAIEFDRGYAEKKISKKCLTVLRHSAIIQASTETTARIQRVIWM